MELKGSVTIAAPRERVWRALNDPEVLRQCIPGCEEVQQISPKEMHARVQLRMGPVRARFAGKVKMTDIRPLQGYTLNFEGSGGSAGFARGSSAVTLTSVGEGTQLEYTAHASVAGKLGQIGGRLMDASAGQLANRFFANLKAAITGANAPSVDEQRAAAVSTDSGASADTVHVKETVEAWPGFRPGHWIDQEGPRLLWFCAGVLATGLGVFMGARWLH
jgi:uncharacterized protein